jgi:hypothetical protein
MGHKLTAFRAMGGRGDTDLYPELVWPMRLALADALHFWRMQGIDFGSALTLILRQHAPGEAQRLGTRPQHGALASWGTAMRVGPWAFNAFEKASLISCLVRAPTAAQPKPLAVETISNSGRSRAGTLGVFSGSANSWAIPVPQWRLQAAVRLKLHKPHSLSVES